MNIHKSFLFLVFLLVAGCKLPDVYPTITVIPHNPATYPSLATGYSPGSVYTTTQELFILCDKEGCDLREPGGICPFVDQYRAMTEATRKKMYPYIRAILPRGSVLRMKYYQHLSSHGSAAAITEPIMLITGGDHDGTLVSARAVSEFIYGTELGIFTVPNSRYLVER